MVSKEEQEIINIQLTAIIISLLPTIISILLTYNQKLNLDNQKGIFNSKNVLSLTYFNRILIVILSIVFFYVNYRLYRISKKEGESLESYIYQIIASILTIAASLIALYVVTFSEKETLVDVENPII